jgi:hypothetical protein
MRFKELVISVSVVSMLGVAPVFAQKGDVPEQKEPVGSGVVKSPTEKPAQPSGEKGK